MGVEVEFTFLPFGMRGICAIRLRSSLCLFHLFLVFCIVYSFPWHCSQQILTFCIVWLVRGKKVLTRSSSSWRCNIRGASERLWYLSFDLACRLGGKASAIIEILLCSPGSSRPDEKAAPRHLPAVTLTRSWGVRAEGAKSDAARDPNFPTPISYLCFGCVVHASEVPTAGARRLKSLTLSQHDKM